MRPNTPIVGVTNGGGGSAVTRLRRPLVVLVGLWPSMPAGLDILRARGLLIQRCPPDVRSLKELIASLHPTWLLIGQGPDEVTIRTLVHSGQAMDPDLQLAMLGPIDDLRRCDRWMRRGCSVYLASDADADRVAAVLTVAGELKITIVDRVFRDAARARLVPPAGNLTRREEEVLQLMCVGLRNSDIAQTLHLTENTVEFHVSRLLAKLGARNRVEAVDRALSLGLS
jgi:DNA-binding NarL/FixJ family response regulator